MVKISKIIGIFISISSTEAAFNVDYGWADVTDYSHQKILDQTVCDTPDSAKPDNTQTYAKNLAEYEKVFAKYTDLFNRHHSTLSEHDKAMVRYDVILYKNEQAWHKCLMSMSRYGFLAKWEEQPLYFAQVQ